MNIKVNKLNLEKTHLNIRLFKYFLISHGYFIKTVSIISLCILLSISTLGQNTNSVEGKIYFGLSVGKESFIGLPKMGGMLTLPFKNTTISRYTHQPNSFHFISADLSIFLLGASFVAPSVSYGIYVKPFSIENSVTYAFAIGSASELTRKWLTTNPKIGIKIGKVWFKTGLSFELWHKDYHDNSINDWMKVKGLYLNFDLLFFINLEETLF